MDFTDICKQGISSNAVAEAAAKITQFNKEKSIGINQKKKKATFTFIPTSRSAALPTHHTRESPLSLCTQIKLHRSSTVLCQNIQL